MTDADPFRIDHPATDVQTCEHDTLVWTDDGLRCRECDDV